MSFLGGSQPFGYKYKLQLCCYMIMAIVALHKKMKKSQERLRYVLNILLWNIMHGCTNTERLQIKEKRQKQMRIQKNVQGYLLQNLHHTELANKEREMISGIVALRHFRMRAILR